MESQCLFSSFNQQTPHRPDTIISPQAPTVNVSLKSPCTVVIGITTGIIVESLHCLLPSTSKLSSDHHQDPLPPLLFIPKKPRQKSSHCHWHCWSSSHCGHEGQGNSCQSEAGGGSYGWCWQEQRVDALCGPREQVHPYLSSLARSDKVPRPLGGPRSFEGQRGGTRKARQWGPIVVYPGHHIGKFSYRPFLVLASLWGWRSSESWPSNAGLLGDLGTTAICGPPP